MGEKSSVKMPDVPDVQLKFKTAIMVTHWSKIPNEKKEEARVTC